jgi:N-acetylglucosamine-6-phosphate deacetylase
MKCNGFDLSRGETVEIGFTETIQSVDPLLSGGQADEVFVAPGWIDLQVNGFGGVDFNSPTASSEQIAASLQRMFSTGTTRLFPTVITGAPQLMRDALHNLSQAKKTMPAIEGLHMEGPYICPDDGPRGAHPRQWARPPDWDEFRRFQDAAEGHIRLVTLSPEWPRSSGFIEQLVRHGVVVSIGHTKANSAEIVAAVDAGATLSTHLGNGAHAVLPKFPNYIWDQLAEERLAASFIVDGIHLPPAFLQVALKAKGLEHALLVTDAVAPAGCQPGPYQLGEVAVELHADQSVRLAGGTRLAGSALMMHHSISNMIRIAGISLRDAVMMATRNPARVGRIAGRQRGLNPGERADLVRFRFRNGIFQILETFVGGVLVYGSAENRSISGW